MKFLFTKFSNLKLLRSFYFFTFQILFIRKNKGKSKKKFVYIFIRNQDRESGVSNRLITIVEVWHRLHWWFYQHYCFL